MYSDELPDRSLNRSTQPAPLPMLYQSRTWMRAVVALFAIVPLHVVASETAKPRIDPAVTRVVLLSPVDESSGIPPMAPLRTQLVRIRQQFQFLSRHFVVLGEGMAEKAAAISPAIAVDTAADRSATTLDRLGTRMAADWIVSITITAVGLDADTHFDGSHFACHATITLQIRDVRHHAWIANLNHTTRTTGSGAPPELLFSATESAAEEALNDVLSPFPVVAQVSQDGAIVDYLRGQQAAVICDPDTVFTGLDPTQFARAHR